MKKSSLTQLMNALCLGGIATFHAIAAAATQAQPNAGTEETTFFCGEIEGTPATIARTSKAEIPIVIWTSDYLADTETDPQQQCEEVTQRFQTYSDLGKLNYITTGMMNGKIVACVADGENEPCSGLLFPLNSDRNPGGNLQRIFRIRVASAGPIMETPRRVYINLNKYLNGEYPSLPAIDRRTPRPLTNELPE